MDIEIFEEKLDKLFADAIGVEDTIWYSETETLRDAILDMIDMEIPHKPRQRIKGTDDDKYSLEFEVLLDHIDDISEKCKAMKDSE